MNKRVLLASASWLLLATCLGCSSPQRVPFFKVRAFETALWLIGSGSYVSVDGGLTWESRDFGFDCDGGLHPITMSRRISICGPETVFQTFDRELKVTEDGGHTWQTIPFASDSRRPPGEVFFRDRQKGVVVNYDGIAYTTEDGGLSWVNAGLHKIQDVAYVNGLTWILGHKELWTWDDTGEWRLVAEVPPLDSIASCEDVLVLGGYRGYLGQYSPGSGRLMQFQPSVTVRYSSRSAIESIRCVDGGLAVLTGFDLFVLARGASEWQSVAPEEMDHAWSMDALGDRLYVVGGDWADWLLRGSLGSRFALVCESQGNGGCKPLNPPDGER